VHLFTTTPFRNWTHSDAAITGQVRLAVDWRIPIYNVRADLARVLHPSPHWDGRRGDLVVNDAFGPTLQLLALVSAADGDALAELRC